MGGKQKRIQRGIEELAMKKTKKGTAITKGVSTKDLWRDFKAGNPFLYRTKPGFWEPGKFNTLPPVNAVTKTPHLVPCMFNGKKCAVMIFPRISSGEALTFTVSGDAALDIYDRLRLMLAPPKKQEFKPKVPKKLK